MNVLIALGIALLSISCSVSAGSFADQNDTMPSASEAVPSRDALPEASSNADGQCQSMMAEKAKKACQEIEVAYQKFDAAVAKKDLEAVRSLLASDYVQLETSGEELSLVETLRGWQNQLADASEPNFQTVIERIDLQGDEVVVLARSKYAFTRPSLNSKVRIEMTRRDRWINSASSWNLRYSAYTSLKWWLDDKLVQESKGRSPLTAGERAAVVSDLSNLAHPFNTVITGNGFDDLTFLDSVVGDACIVALGEASHGTAEFFQMKHRLLEYLVEKKGFTVFAIEGNWPEALVADRYIKSGEGDAAASLAAMYFWTWQTQEVRAMLEWMREYNAKRGDRPALSFSGFDMQYPRVAMKLVTDLFARIGDTDSEAIKQLYAGIDKLQQKGADLSEANMSRLKDSAAKALDLVQSKREELLKVATPDEYQDALQAARIMQQFIALWIAQVNSGTIGYAASRDQSMAENVRWLAEQKFPGQKIVLWAHNAHVGSTITSGPKPMGAHLRETYGDKMVVLGFASHSGEVRAKGLISGKWQPGGPVALKLAPPKPISIEGLFAETGLPRAVIDFRHMANDNALAKWLTQPRLHRSIGAGFDPDSANSVYEEVDLPKAYDGLIYIAQSTAAKPLN